MEENSEKKNDMLSMKNMLTVYKPNIDAINFYLSSMEKPPEKEFDDEEDLIEYIRENLRADIIKELQEFHEWCKATRREIVKNIDGNKKLAEDVMKLTLALKRIIDTIEKDETVITDSATRAIAEDVKKEALEILKTGLPINYILKVWHRDYIGNEPYGTLLVLSVACGTCDNTMGLHPSTEGPSGSGKSWGMKVMIVMVPPEHVVRGTISPKSLFYKKGLKAAAIIFLDDIGQLDPELQRIIKIATTNYQEEMEHTTVKDGEGLDLKIPSRLNWWITGVEVGSLDIQILNRNVNVSLDEDKNTKAKRVEDVYQHQKEDAKTGRRCVEITRETLVAREMFRILLEAEPVNIMIPWLDAMTWNCKDNPRNYPVFLDLIRVSASIHRYQRPTVDGRIVATLDDYDIAMIVWNGVSRETATKLNKKDQAILQSMKRLGAYKQWVSMMDIATDLKMNYEEVRRLIFGRPDRGTFGLMHRYPAIQKKEDTFTEYEKDEYEEYDRIREKKTGSISHTRVWFMLLEEPNMFESSNVVLDRDNAKKLLEPYISGSGSRGIENGSNA